MKSTQSIVAGYATKGQGAGPLIVTERAGYFRKHGLDVEIRLMGGATGVVNGLMDGTLQFGNLAAPALVRSCLTEGADLVYLTGGINQQFLVSRPEIKSIDELSGKRIGLVKDGGLNDFLTSFIAEKLKIKGVGDLKLVPAPLEEAERKTAFFNGEWDAVVLTPPDAVEAKRLGCHFIVDFADYGINFALGGIAARRSYISQNEAVVRKFILAYVEGMRRYRTDREFTIKVQQEYSGLSDSDVAAETYDLSRAGMPQMPYPVLQGLLALLGFWAKELPEARNADASEFVDDRFVREAEKHGTIASA
jgi:ABC-type nitrate/sulfonate/bicarbonate transport system substrate-binding protein